MILFAKPGWIALSFLSAFFDSGVHLLSKHTLSKSGQYFVPCVLCLVSGLFCFILLLFTGVPRVDVSFFYLVLLVSIIAGIGMVLFMTGLEKSEVSYSIPLLCFTPLMSAIWGWLFIGESVTYWGLVGVMVVMTGAYMLELHRMTEGIFSPIIAVFNNFSARLILFASVLWSITSVIDKVGVLQGSALLWSSCVSTGMGFFILLIGIKQGSINKQSVKGAPWGIMIVLGICYALMHFCQMSAIEIGQISYVLSLKRLSILISVVIGSLLFNEHQLRQRLMASVVMILGVLIIIFCA